MLVEIYTDGSATTQNNPGGWAYVITVDGEKVYEDSGSMKNATNNMAEITAAIEGMQYVENAIKSGNSIGPAVISPDCEVVLVADSQLVLRYATGEYKCKAYHLLPLYIKLRKHFGNIKATTRWVKGHAGDEHNERCDVLAKAARESLLQL